MYIYIIGAIVCLMVPLPRGMSMNTKPRWSIDQVYVNKMINSDPTVKKNAREGGTISVRKRGWTQSFELARRLAGWI